MSQDKIMVERTQAKLYSLVTSCIQEIRETVETSGVSFRDVGVKIGKYKVKEGAYIIELKLTV